jgi:hypothetical protein
MLHPTVQSLDNEQLAEASQNQAPANVGVAGLPLFIADPTTHCMGPTLRDYVFMKIHSEIKDKLWSRIIVAGSYTRLKPALISSAEKQDKPFNWQRPTATIVNATTIQINCFPGQDYVKHYAYLLANYLSLIGQNPSIVRYQIPEPSTSLRLLLESNIAHMGHTDIVIVGYVHRLKKFLHGSWEWGGQPKKGLFGWQKFQSSAGHSVALLGCVVSFWGDIAGDLIRALQRLNKIRCVLYVGKTGALQPQHRPNEVLATGNHSFIDSESISWTNVLEPCTAVSNKVCRGNHVTLCSAILEDQAWLTRWQGCSWVDSEVGHMAKASNEGKTAFGYLHIVSDNLACRYPYDLSNERVEEVVLSRENLLIEVENVLEIFFSTWTYRK